jgi:hypothetical protein
VTTNLDQLHLPHVLPPVEAARAGAKGDRLHVVIVKPGTATPVVACGCHPTLRGRRQARNVKHRERCVRKGCRERWPTPTRKAT